MKHSESEEDWIKQKNNEYLRKMMCNECNWPMTEQYEKRHLYTSDQKLEWFGYGEWVEEPDEVIFEHKGVKCMIKRMLAFENCGDAFGGYFCGYVCIPKNHKNYAKDPFKDFRYDCHGGLTYGRLEENEEYWIGFDCAHSGDLIPSMEKLKQSRKDLFKECFEGLQEYKKMYPHLFINTYRNIDYCINECKSLAEQVMNDYE
jgi:hypothetical protein